MKDFWNVVSIIMKERTSVGTLMNVARDGHEGSSRSHCAIVLTLYQLEIATNKFSEKQFHLVDLAGAERPEKAGLERSGFQTMLEKIYARKPLNNADAGFLINFELSNLLTDVTASIDAQKKGIDYKTPSQGMSLAVSYLGTSFNGGAVTDMIICISQAP